MTMREENKHNLFFSAEDSPIPVPPAEEAWSLMQRQLNMQLPVGSGGADGAGWFGRFLRLRWWRWGLPSAVVAIVTMGVVVGLHQAGQRHSGAGAVRQRGAAGRAGAVDSVGAVGVKGLADAVGRVDSVGAVARVRGSAGRDAGIAGKVPASGASIGRKETSGASIVRKGAGGESISRKGTSGKTKGANKENANKEKADKENVSIDRKATNGRTRGAPANLVGASINPGEVSREGLEEWRHGRREGNAAVLLRAPIGPDHGGGDFTDGLAASLGAGRAGKGPLAGKDLLAGKGPKVNAGKASAKSGKGKDAPKKGGLLLGAGVSVGKNFAIGQQQAVTYNSTGGSGLIDYLPGAYFRVYLNDRWVLQAGLQVSSPQYTRSRQIDSTGDSSRLIGLQQDIQDTILTLKKLYYTNIPVNVYYRVAGHFYLGAGLQYSRLTGGAVMQRVSLHPSNPGIIGDSVLSSGITPLKTNADGYRVVAHTDWRVLLEAAYMGKRFTAGLKFQQALSPYLLGLVGGARDKNTAFGVYLSYDIWQRSRKK